MIADNIERIKQELPSDVMLVAVSKFHPSAAVREAYACGQRVFAESRPQELQQKALELGGRFPSSPEGPCPEIEWHFIGHLQTNKLKMVLPYVTLVQSVDSLHLLKAINDWGSRNGRVTDVLLEVHIGAEETKQGFREEEVVDILFDAGNYPFVRFCGLMGMASNTDDTDTVAADFTRIDSLMAYLVDLFPELASFRQLSIGMSGDWKIALQHGATIVRIGTAIFGQRDYGTR